MVRSELLKFLKSRRSIRKFKQTPVPTETINSILDAATYAPSAHNKQPWRFAILSTDEKKAKLANAITGKFRNDLEQEGIPEKEITEKVNKSIKRLVASPVVIVLCREAMDNFDVSDDINLQKETIMDIQSTAMAGLQLLLAAHAEGLGGIWICWPLFAPDETCRALTLPHGWEPQGMLFIGYPDESPKQPERKILSNLILNIP